MNTPEQTADNLLSAIFDTARGGVDYQAKVGRNILDGLIGTDKNAIVQEIKIMNQEIPAAAVEMVTDQIFNMLEAGIIAKLTAEEDPPVQPT